MKVYAVVDKKAKEFVSVFPSNSDEAAERSFLMLLTGPKNIFTDFPEDFALYPVADLSLDGYLLNVTHIGDDVLLSQGFKGRSFSVSSPVKEGSEYGRSYLSALHAERFPIIDDEVKSDE